MQPLGQGYHGGNPPTLSDITDDVDKIDEFVNMWLGTHTKLSIEIQRFLVANMLRHWDETVLLIQKEPKNTYAGDNYKKHSFITRVVTIRNYLKIDDETFAKWIVSVRHGFIRKNAISMSQQNLKEVGYSNVSIDGRYILDNMEANTTQ